MKVVVEITHTYRPDAKPGDLPIVMDAAVARTMPEGHDSLCVVAMAFLQKGGAYNVHDIEKGGAPVRYQTRGGALRALNRRAGL